MDFNVYFAKVDNFPNILEFGSAFTPILASKYFKVILSNFHLETCRLSILSLLELMKISIVILGLSAIRG